MKTESAEKQSDIKPTNAALVRIAGPGTLYNVGNLIGLLSGIAFAINAGETGSAIADYFLGDLGAVALTIAMIVFFVSGEYYRRADAASTSGFESLLRRADLLSGIGALALSVALLWYGDYVLALVSTSMLAGGKFGNAMSRTGSFPVRVEIPRRSATQTLHFDLFRLSVVFSRFPAMLGLAKTVFVNLNVANTSTLQAMILLLCYALWLTADLLLMRRSE